MDFLIHFVVDGKYRCNKVVNSYEVIAYTNMNDVCAIDEIVVYAISESGDVKRLRYKGWQPNCLIEYVDEDGNVIISGYGEDH